MRTTEAAGTGKTPITRAQGVKKSDFGRHEIIGIVHHGLPHLDPDFLTFPLVTLPLEMVRFCSLVSWMQEVCGLAQSDVFIHQRETNL